MASQTRSNQRAIEDTNDNEGDSCGYGRKPQQHGGHVREKHANSNGARHGGIAASRPKKLSHGYQLQAGEPMPHSSTNTTQKTEQYSGIAEVLENRGWGLKDDRFILQKSNGRDKFQMIRKSRRDFRRKLSQHWDFTLFFSWQREAA